jgi:hypothetical protein
MSPNALPPMIIESQVLANALRCVEWGVLT